MNGAQSLLQTLVDAGVEVCFANPGTSEMHFVAALDVQQGMRGVLGLFEGVVTGAADGYARMAGKPACTLLHLGPGLANGLANLHNARRANSGVVNVVGEHATYHRALDAPLSSDIEGFAAPRVRLGTGLGECSGGCRRCCRGSPNRCYAARRYRHADPAGGHSLERCLRVRRALAGCSPHPACRGSGDRGSRGTCRRRALPDAPEWPGRQCSRPRSRQPHRAGNRSQAACRHLHRPHAAGRRPCGNRPDALFRRAGPGIACRYPALDSCGHQGPGEFFRLSGAPQRVDAPGMYGTPVVGAGRGCCGGIVRTGRASGRNRIPACAGQAATARTPERADRS